MLRNLLGKLVMEEALLGYLERLLGERVGVNDTISVSSTQRARIAAWLQDNGGSTDVSDLGSNRIRIAQLLPGNENLPPNDDEAAQVRPEPSSPRRLANASSSKSGERPIGIGIDIQARTSMPDATDFRSDTFFKCNFSASEIAHCIQQRDPLESFAGLWAAKEAIIKAGAAASGKGGLHAIEITHDGTGVPTYPGCLVSISHDHGLAVAVCVRLA